MRMRANVTAGGSRLTRRTILASAALLPLVPVLGPVLRAETNGKLVPSAAIVIDEIGAHAAAVRRYASLRGRVHRLKPDLAHLYYRELVPQWRARGVRPLIGLTRATPAYMLEQLALEFGQRLVYAQELRPAANVSRDGWLTDLLDRLQLSTTLTQPLIDRDPLREAMLAGTATPFAWCLAPVRNSILTPGWPT